MNQLVFEKNLSYSFSKKNRLCKPSEFSKIFLEGQKFFYAGMVLVGKFESLSSSQSILNSEAKIGFALPKKVIKLAHNRKRLKRLAIEYFRHHKHNFRGGEFVLTLNRSFQSNNFLLASEMNKIFEKLWKKCCDYFQRLNAINDAR